MKYHWAFRPATKAEQKLAYSCELGDKVCKCIGHLRADFGRSGKEFWSSWTDHNPGLKTDAFKEDLDVTINRLRDEHKELSPLRNRSAMSKVCYDYGEAREEGSSLENYIFRVDSFRDGCLDENHSFIMRMNPGVGLYNLYCYCYRTEDLEMGV